MWTYCVTFRIANLTVSGRTYADRYNQLIENLRKGSDGYWQEPTSFILVGSTLDTQSFAAKAAVGLSRTHDLLFVFDPGDMSACYFGAVEAEDVLRSFFPRLKKLE